MTPERLEYFKNKLLQMQEDILDNIIGETVDEENPFEIDGDLADRAEAFTSVTISEGLSSTQKEIIEKIRKALQKIKDGYFGKCSSCGNQIEDERLDAIPYAEKCKKHMNDSR